MLLKNLVFSEEQQGSLIYDLLFKGLPVYFIDESNSSIGTPRMNER
jgi:hypothetical protein